MPDLSPADWENLWLNVRIHGLTPYLHRRWDEAGRLHQLPPDFAERLSDARRQNTERNRRILRLAVDLVSLLQQRHIPVLVSKGLPLAQEYYADIGLRVLFDLDLLVPHRFRESALSLLQGAGFVPFFPKPRQKLGQVLLWRPQEYAWDAERIFDPDRPLMLELHTDAWERGWHGFHLPGDPELWSNTRRVEVEGLPLPAPSEESLLIQLAVHYACNAMESVARLMHLLDVGLLLRSRADALDWDSIIRRATAGQLAGFCCLTLELARKSCGCRPPERALEVLRGATTTPLLRWIETEGPSAICSMSLYRPDRSLIYFLHWNMARGCGARLRMLLASLRAALRDGTGLTRWAAFARRMWERLRHLAGYRRSGREY